MSAEVINMDVKPQGIEAIATDKPTRVAKSKYDVNAKILLPTGSAGLFVNPYRKGSNRWHNFEALAISDPVGEALTAMKKLTPGGNSVDIRLAIEKGAIKLGE